MTAGHSAGEHASAVAPSVVAIGGGHGLAATLRAVRTYTGRVTAIVSVADDGGSSGRLRRQFAIPAPGDLRRCLVALAEPGTPWADAFEYRFSGEAGADLEGHALGNLVIAALAGVTGDFQRALGLAADLLGAGGRVLPATVGPVDLAGEVQGRVVQGQVSIQEAHGLVSALRVVASRVTSVPGPAEAVADATGAPPDATGAPPDATGAPPDAVAAIAAADQVVIGPGSLYTSVLAACVVPDIRAALRRRSGGRTYVCNLRPELPETAGLSSSDHLRVLADHGIDVDAVVYDPRWWPPQRSAGSHPVRTIEADLADDPLAGHDPHRLGQALRRAI